MLSKQWNLNLDLPTTFSISHSDVFYKVKEQWGLFSNFSACPIKTKNPHITLLTSEALYQILRYSDKPHIQQEIISQKSPMAAKMKSKKYYKETADNWENIKVETMIFAIWQKFVQNEIFRVALNISQNPIVERSRKDTFWGAKLHEENQTLTGVNVLGQILDKFKKNKANHLTLSAFPIKKWKILNVPVAELF